MATKPTSPKDPAKTTEGVPPPKKPVGKAGVKKPAADKPITDKPAVEKTTADDKPVATVVSSSSGAKKAPAKPTPVVEESAADDTTPHVKKEYIKDELMSVKMGDEILIQLNMIRKQLDELQKAREDKPAKKAAAPKTKDAPDAPATPAKPKLPSNAQTWLKEKYTNDIDKFDKEVLAKVYKKNPDARKEIDEAETVKSKKTDTAKNQAKISAAYAYIKKNMKEYEDELKAEFEKAKKDSTLASMPAQLAAEPTSDDDGGN